MVICRRFSDLAVRSALLIHSIRICPCHRSLTSLSFVALERSSDGIVQNGSTRKNMVPIGHGSWGKRTSVIVKGEGFEGLRAH